MSKFKALSIISVTVLFGLVTLGSVVSNKFHGRVDTGKFVDWQVAKAQEFGNSISWDVVINNHPRDLTKQDLLAIAEKLFRQVNQEKKVVGFYTDKREIGHGYTLGSIAHLPNGEKNERFGEILGKNIVLPSERERAIVEVFRKFFYPQEGANAIADTEEEAGRLTAEELGISIAEVNAAQDRAAFYHMFPEEYLAESSAASE